MAWQVWTDELIQAIISTMGTPSGGLAAAVVEARPMIWFPTHARLPCIIVEFVEMANTPIDGRSMQEYRINIYYCMDRRTDALAVRTVRMRAEELAENLAAIPRLGLTSPAIENSYVTRIASNFDLQQELAQAEQDVIATLIEFYIRVAQS